MHGPEGWQDGLGRTPQGHWLSWRFVVFHASRGWKIYVPNQSGDVFVLRAAPKFELLATNAVAESTNASLAASDGELFMRTDKALWCFAAK